MARTNLGRVVPLHKGDYSATIEYELNDIVSYNGSTYWHFTHEKTTGILPTETSVWKLVIDMADAEQYIARAETAALQAEGSADDAQSAKTDAETAKADAETAEQGAVSAKQDALASEENARSYMTAAQTAKGQAESARDLAIQAKTDAVDAKQGAESAKDTAVSAKNTAVDAKNTAVSAKTDALAAQDAAESARDLAEGYKDTAVSAKDTAVSAKTAAETAKADAETAKTAAQTAEGNASTSATNAEESAEDAEAWAVGKRNGVDVPSTDPAYHNNAKYYAMLEANKIDANIITNQSITLAQVKTILDEINTNHEHAFFDVSALGASMYLCTIYMDTEKYKIFDLVSGRYTEGAYEASKLLTMCLVNAEGIATQSQIDHLQDEIDELGGIEKIKNWEQLGNLIESGESTSYISAGDKIDVNWIKSVNGTTTHALTVTCTSMQNFIDGVGEAEAKEYYFVFNGTAWTYNEQVIDLADWGLSVTGTVPTGEVMTIVTTVDAVNYTFTGYDDFTPVNPSVPHNWCLEQTYAPSTKAYDTYEAVFNLAPGKTLPAGNYKLHAPYYGSSPMIDIYFTIPSAFTATNKVLQFASTGYQNVACIPGSETNYYIASAICPAYKDSNTYVASEISVLYNQTGDWTDISTIDGITITPAHIQTALGNNCPAHCNLRQWLNDDSATGHYEATNAFDRPSSYNFTKGFLYGLDPRVRNLMLKCKTKFTAGYNNEGYTQGQVYENEDDVFLLSMKEMSFNIQTGEGNVTDLYNEYCEGVLTNNAIAARAKYNKAGGTLNSYRWSRSALSSYAYSARGVGSSGAYDSSGAFGANYFAPAFIIGKASENL